jgi:2-oxoisovalerate dehydrogenase E1 component alpha subunit
MQFLDNKTPIPIFRIVDSKGHIVDPAYQIPVSDEELKKMYTAMVQLNEMDTICYQIQRQGRVTFYMTATGEEAIHIGVAAAIQPNDEIFAQYREAGILQWRGFSIQNCLDQLFSNEADLGKGRQMPVHYGSRNLHFQTISSPLATQLPQASGAAYALKIAKEDRLVICLFGEGAASEGDFHPALNFASTLECPMLFICRNNGYAISTPVHEQFRGDGIAARGAGYGITTIRCDGNDLLAVYDTVKAARALAVEQSKPVLIECMTYRVGPHSTSDDSDRYRSKEEQALWNENENPITRIRRLMENRGAWDDAQELDVKKRSRAAVLDALQLAEGRLKPPISQLFKDTFKDLTPNLQEQQANLLAHLAEYGENYDLHQFAQDADYVEPR